MAYIALYRKYRSQSFAEVMGQDAVTTVLQNSLRSGKIAHAYLFFGARGCGKTSTARLLSRALNCEAQPGPTPEPCGVCKICVAIRNGACMDVVEIDAASETGVDNVREKIIENVQYVPTEARYKVYIIDEVHDLSAKAFDALLKTLEEPPPHVVFVLATTEQHKVPITIRSRCIPFQFKRGTLSDLSTAIERVIDAEGYHAEPGAVRAIARCAEGSWRDALSLLEQVVAYSESTITEEGVQQALGTVGSAMLGRVVDTLAQNDWAATLAIAGELIDSGKDVRQLISSLSGYLRDLLLIASGAVNTAELELGADRTEQLTPQAKLYTPGQLLTLLGILATAEKETRVNNQHRWLLERTLCNLMPVNLTTAESNSSLTRLPAPATTPAQILNSRAKPVVRADTQRFTSPTQSSGERHIEANSTTSVGAAHAQNSIRLDTPGPALVSAETSNVSAAESRFMGDVTLTVVQRAWPRILKAIEKVSPSAAGYLQKATVVDLEQKVIVLTFSDVFARDRILNKGKALVEKKINEVLQSEGFRIRLRHEDEGGSSEAELIARTVTPNTPGHSAASVTPSTLDLSGDVENSRIVKDSSEQSMLEETLEIFGGEVIRSEQSRGSTTSHGSGIM